MLHVLRKKIRTQYFSLDAGKLEGGFFSPLFKKDFKPFLDHVLGRFLL